MRNLGRGKAIEVILFGVLLGLLACGKGTVPAVPSPVALPTTPLPSPTPSPRPTEPLPSPTPMPSPTPASPPLWRIYFEGCPGLARCEPHEDIEPQVFFVNSDGSGLTPAFEDFAMVRFSPDGSRLAYIDGPDIVLANLDGSNPVRFPGIYRRLNFAFLGNSCLVLLPSKESVVTVQRICTGDSVPQVLDTVEFPGSPTYRFYEISPQGDKLLAYNIGGHLHGDVYIYTKMLGSDEPPQLLFYAPSPCRIISIRWLSEEMMGFLLDCGGDESSFYQVDRPGEKPWLRLVVPGIGIETGDWSPDGREFACNCGEESGICILDLVTGERRKIVSEMGIYYILSAGPVESR